MEIQSAKFVLSAQSLKDCPKNHFPEIAFIGRSNVGKSSLINMICGRNELARTSSTPGKTISLNFYLINNNWHLVDLPGYGYARRSKNMRFQWEQNLLEYIENRKQLASICVLIDSRIPPQKIDLEFIDYLGEKSVPFTIIFTKTDKLKSSELENFISHYQKILSESWENLPSILISSSIQKTGKSELESAFQQIIKTFRTMEA